MASITAWKVSEYGVFSGTYFPAFELNTDIYEVISLKNGTISILQWSKPFSNEQKLFESNVWTWTINSFKLYLSQQILVRNE